MSIIITQINKYGIILGSDSNVSSNDRVLGERAKIFEITKLGAALCVAGSYTVGGEMLDVWMPTFINSKQDSRESLEGFVVRLSTAFEEQMTPAEKSNLSISQISGYVDGHPEMWCLSNTTLLENGTYSIGSDKFHYSEDFWKRDYDDGNFEDIFKSNGLNYQMYVNSIMAGRVAFNIVRQYIDQYFYSMWKLPNFKFRCPESLNEHRLLVKSYLDIIDTMFNLSDYNPKIVGGKTQLLVIKNPGVIT